jgi:hypothetical protein
MGYDALRLPTWKMKNPADGRIHCVTLNRRNQVKKRSAYIWHGLLLAVLLSSCAYSHVQRPLDTDYDSTSLGSKVGRAHIQSALWLFAWGDAGSKAAADDGGITVIKHADTETTIILFGLYSRFTTVVYGD